LLEFHILNNVFILKFFIGHRNFVINCFIGLFASSLLALVISIVSYFSEKYKIIKNLYSINIDVYIQCDFFTRWVIQYCQKEEFSVPDEKVEQFQEHLKTLLSVLEKALFINISYCPINMYDNNINFIKHYQAKKEQFIFCQFDYSKNIQDVYGKTKIAYVLLTRAALKTNKAEFFTQEFINKFRKLMKSIDTNSKLKESGRRLEKSLIKILKLEKNSTKDQSN